MFSEFDTHVKYMTFLPPYYRYIALFFFFFFFKIYSALRGCKNDILSKYTSFFFYSFCFSLSEWITTLVRIKIPFDVTVSDECLKRHIAEDYNTSMHLPSNLVNLFSY